MSTTPIYRRHCNRCPRVISEHSEPQDPTPEALRVIVDGDNELYYDDLCDPCRATCARLIAKMRRGGEE